MVRGAYTFSDENAKGNKYLSTFLLFICGVFWASFLSDTIYFIYFSLLQPHLPSCFSLIKSHIFLPQGLCPDFFRLPGPSYNLYRLSPQLFVKSLPISQFLNETLLATLSLIPQPVSTRAPSHWYPWSHVLLVFLLYAHIVFKFYLSVMPVFYLFPCICEFHDGKDFCLFRYLAPGLLLRTWQTFNK